MVVSLLLKILGRYSLCSNGVKIQYTTHKHEYWWEDEIYNGNIIVIPYDKDGKLNYYASRYFHDVNFKLQKNRDAFSKLVDLYNSRNKDKKDFVPLYQEENYCTFQ